MDVTTETLDKIYLEWSQFTKAKTHRELQLEARIKEIANSKSWEEQVALSELALSDIENRPAKQFAMRWLSDR